MRLLLSSDWHGNLPELPKHDVLLLAGDNCPDFVGNNTQEGIFQKEWYFSHFKKHIQSLDNYCTIGIAGNHEFWGKDTNQDKGTDKLGFHKCEIYGYTDKFLFQGMKIGVCPYSLRVGEWAFGKSEAELKNELDKIGSCDILITHGPAKNIMDGKSWGSYALLKYIEDFRPKIVIHGHVHSCFGIKKYNDTTIINCSLLNDQYKISNKPILLDITTSFSLAEI